MLNDNCEIASVDEIYLGKTDIIMVVPFIIDEGVWNTAVINHESNLIVDYCCSERGPKLDLLKRIVQVEKDVYSSNFLCSNSISRFYLGKYVVDQLNYLSNVDIILNLYGDGVGTFHIISSDNLFASTDGIISTMIEVKKILNYNLIPISFENRCENITLLDILDELVIYKKKNKINEHCKFGEVYPYINLYSYKNSIEDISTFTDDHIKDIYGIARMDNWGWKRIRNDKALNLIGENLSYKEEYSIYITSNSILEINNTDRICKISDWAIHEECTFSNLFIKMMYERVLSIEVIRIQKLFLTRMNDKASEMMNFRGVNHKNILQARGQMAKKLNQYFDISAISNYHISGEYWIEYGKEIMGIEKTYDFIKERLEGLEILYDITLKSSEHRMTTSLSLVTTLLAASASTGIIDIIFSIPIIESLDIINIKWLFTLVLFLLISVISWLIISKSIITRKKI